MCDDNRSGKGNVSLQRQLTLVASTSVLVCDGVSVRKFNRALDFKDLHKFNNDTAGFHHVCA